MFISAEANEVAEVEGGGQVIAAKPSTSLHLVQNGRTVQPCSSQTDSIENGPGAVR